MKRSWSAVLSVLVLLAACAEPPAPVAESDGAASHDPVEMVPEPDFVLTSEQTHDKFSNAIPPAITVPSGSVIEAYTHEATGGQFELGSTADALATLDMDKVHTLTGPVYVEGAEPGDVLAVELLEIEPGDWGWMAIIPNFGFLADEIHASVLETFPINKVDNVLEFAEGVRVPLAPFAGVMGVAPDTDEMLNTIPPRANGGNMDDPNLVVGTTVYFPVFAPGGLFSIGDTHAAQGLGEVSGTAIETPMRIVYRISIVEDAPSIAEPQYETDDYYATTGFGTSIDEAARKATRYMIDHLMERRGLTEHQAYMLCSLAGDLKIAETVDVPHMLVAMHMPKAIFTG